MSLNFRFKGPYNGAEVLHHLTAVRDAFRFKEGKLRGMVNFGNDVGWFRLALRYAKEGSVREDSVSFEVLPTKLDMAGDLAGIHRIVDQEYPLWRFAFGRKTESELSRSQRPHERFALLWLAHFAALRNELLSNARIICNSPHSRLQESCRRLPLSRLRGKPGYRLEEHIADALAENETERLFVVKSRKLSADTPENRFVKMVLNRCSRELGGFRRRAAEMNNSPDRERLSPRFFDELDAWQSGLDKRAAHSLFSEVGTFEGMDKESLVLQRRAGYAGVYRVWQHLKRYLDVFGNHASISLKSVSELYEIWCLLEIRRMILELGFEEKSTVKASLRLKGFEKELKDGLGASFRFFRSDGLELRLAHEPVFGKPGRRELYLFLDDPAAAGHPS